MNIAVLSINIGDYIVFWDDFYNSAEENFFPDSKKTYYVFTDKDNYRGLYKSNVKVIHQENLGWPFNTMKRFHMFLSILEELKGFDYIFFANANAKFVKKIDSGIISKDKQIITVEHPGYHLKTISQKPFERRRGSLAYVPLDQGKYYVQGAFYGGQTNAFLRMIEELDNLTEQDLNKNIVAIWHDESFLNMYVSKYPELVQILGWQYMYYEEYVLPYDPVILLRNKRKYLTNKNGRFRGENFTVKKITLFLRNLKWNILIHTRKMKKENNIKNGEYFNIDINI